MINGKEDSQLPITFSFLTHLQLANVREFIAATNIIPVFGCSYEQVGTFLAAVVWLSFSPTEVAGKTLS